MSKKTALTSSLMICSRTIIWGPNIIWDTNANIMWGTRKTILWDMARDRNTQWGPNTFVKRSNIVWGTDVIWGTHLADPALVIGQQDGDNIIWGTDDGGNIIWGTLDGDNIVWGTDVFPGSAFQP